MDEILDRLGMYVALHLAPRVRGVMAWVDQRNTPLGRNAHCAAVRRRVDEAKGTGAEPDAVITPKGVYLMSPEAVLDELKRLALDRLRRVQPKPANETTEPGGEPPDSDRARLLERLRGLR
jgi:hypothetical protein